MMGDLESCSTLPEPTIEDTSLNIVTSKWNLDAIMKDMSDMKRTIIENTGNIEDNRCILNENDKRITDNSKRIDQIQSHVNKMSKHVDNMLKIINH